MKIGIVTQPLKSNYGGILQNWALQQVLKKLGHEPITIDALPRDVTYKYFIVQNILSIIALFIPGKKRRFIPLYMHRPSLFDDFVKKHIVTTETMKVRTSSVLRKYSIDAIIVGSDQVWRPLYNIGCEMDPFLGFAKDFKGIKASYAASFGTEFWEYTEKQTRDCKSLIKNFKKVSVREPSGIDLCKKYLGVEADLVLDPTLLLSKVDYMELIDSTPKYCDKPFLAAYVLNGNDNISQKVKQKAAELNLKPIIFTADCDASLAIEQWLSIFRDADYIITDSFHGSIFSFIFNKDFEYVANNKRGASRFKVIENLLIEKNTDLLRSKCIDYLENVYGTANH